MTKVSKWKGLVEKKWYFLAELFLVGLLIVFTCNLLTPKKPEIEKPEPNIPADIPVAGLIPNVQKCELVLPQLEITDGSGKPAKTDVYKALDGSGKIVGFAFAASGEGFEDEIKLLIAVDAHCEKYFGYKVLKCSDSPGYGDEIRNDFFKNQFAGAPTGKLELIKTGKAEEIDEKIVAISGATTSSAAVIKIFNACTGKVKAQLKAKGLII
jgi:Na+-translocating ferredoxin:NAD+ oxidoreductase subunit G